jgi:hypothetical protein
MGTCDGQRRNNRLAEGESGLIDGLEVCDMGLWFSMFIGATVVAYLCTRRGRNDAKQPKPTKRQ